MSVIGKISIGMGVETGQFGKELAQAGGMLDNFQSGVTQSGTGLDGPASSIGEAGQLAATVGGQMRSALAEGLAPLTKISGTMATQFNALGGTLTTFARRVDGAMKSQEMEKTLVKLETRFPNAFVKTAASGVRAFEKITGFVRNFGDVAGKPLDRLQKFTFAAPIAGAARLAGNLTHVAPTINRATGAARSFGRELLVAAGVFGLAYKVVEFFKGGITGASNLGETMSKTNEVFGKSTGTVTAQANEMAKAFGLPKAELLDAASAFGLIARGMGQTQDQAATLANRMAKLAADSASFFNTDNATALEKIRAGLTGESEPLKAFGVIINETITKQEALRLGLVKGTGALTERAKFEARASLISKGLATATGDLERTQGSAANQFRKTTGGLQNFATSIGELLLPAVQSGVGAFNELLASIVETFEGNKDTISAWSENLKSAVDAVAWTVRNFGGVWEIVQIKVAEFAANSILAIGTFGENAVTVAGWIGRNWSQLIVDGVNASLTALHNFGDYLGRVAYAAYEFFQNPTKGFKPPDWKPLLEGFVATTEQFPELLKPVTVSMQDQIDAVGKRIAEKEAKRAAAMNKVVPGAKKETGKAGDMAGGDKFASLAELGSAEAYSAIIKHQSGGAGADPIKDVAKTAKEQLAEQRQTRILMGRFIDQSLGTAAGVFSMG